MNPFEGKVASSPEPAPASAGPPHSRGAENAEFNDIERNIDVDFWGVVHGTKAFLPQLIASGDGHVVNISSVFGLIAVPGQSACNAAKCYRRRMPRRPRLRRVL